MNKMIITVYALFTLGFFVNPNNTNAQAKKVFYAELDDTKVISKSNNSASWRFEKDFGSLQGVGCEHSATIFGDRYVSFDVRQEWEYFEAHVGIDKRTKKTSRLTITVDGRVAEEITVTDKPQKIHIKLNRAKVMRFDTEGTGVVTTKFCEPSLFKRSNGS